MGPYDEDSLVRMAKLVDRATGTVIGSVRILLPDENNLLSSFPIQKKFHSRDLLDKNTVSKSCEIAVLKLCDKAIDDVFRLADNPFLGISVFRDVYECLAINGLIKAAFEIALRSNIVNCFSMLEFSDLQRFYDNGLKCNSIGEAVNYGGLKQAINFNILEVFNYAKQYENRLFYDLVSDEGRLYHLAEGIDFERELAPLNESHPPALLSEFELSILT